MDDLVSFGVKVSLICSAVNQLGRWTEEGVDRLVGLLRRERDPGLVEPAVVLLGWVHGGSSQDLLLSVK